MLTRIRRLFGRWQQLGCAQALTDRELHDLGMTRAQIMSFVTMPAEVPDRLGRMAALFGIPEDELQSNRAEYLELLQTCACCSVSGPCARLLARGPDALTEHAGFCPNAPGLANHIAHAV